MEPITVTVERTGGFAGIPIRRSISTATLDQRQQEKLRELIEGSNLFGYSAPISTPQPDRFSYTITAEMPQGKRTLHVGEADMPQSLRELVEWILKQG